MIAIQIRVTKDQLADCFACTVLTIHNLEKVGVIGRLPETPIRYDLREAMRSYSNHLREGAAGRSQNLSAKELAIVEGGLLKQANRKLAELKLESERSNLLQKNETIALWQKNAATFKAAILGLPAKLKLAPAETKRAPMGFKLDERAYAQGEAVAKQLMAMVGRKIGDV